MVSKAEGAESQDKLELILNPLDDSQNRNPPRQSCNAHEGNANCFAMALHIKPQRGSKYSGQWRGFLRHDFAGGVGWGVGVLS